ncbi:hypothetical protein FZEAL_8352 [Fusarium zealandicum]|uniref:Uncharacterized protein n=1 Tax=Fusarium zealandicum TaxID=1053134 RepID=A0A8H4XGW7_9HYPO|nr:hypothetical protein FZEAL_8352 [Fusarium zealandicum]
MSSSSNTNRRSRANTVPGIIDNPPVDRSKSPVKSRRERRAIRRNTRRNFGEVAGAVRSDSEGEGESKGKAKADQDDHDDENESENEAEDDESSSVMASAPGELARMYPSQPPTPNFPVSSSSSSSSLPSAASLMELSPTTPKKVDGESNVRILGDAENKEDGEQMKEN